MSLLRCVPLFRFVSPDIIIKLIEEMDLGELMVFLVTNQINWSLDDKIILMNFKLGKYINKNMFSDNKLDYLLDTDNYEDCCGIVYEPIDKRHKFCNKEKLHTAKIYQSFYIELFSKILGVQTTNYSDNADCADSVDCAYDMVKIFFNGFSYYSPVTKNDKLYCCMKKVGIITILKNLVSKTEDLCYVTPNLLGYWDIIIANEFKDNIQPISQSEYPTIYSIITNRNISGDELSHKYIIQDTTHQTFEKYYRLDYLFLRYLNACDRIDLLKNVVKLVISNNYKIRIDTSTSPEWRRLLIVVNPLFFDSQMKFFFETKKNIKFRTHLDHFQSVSKLTNY